MRILRLSVLLLLVLVSMLTVVAQPYAGYVDPRIGTVGLGRTFIGPSMPFGMVKPGPDCVTMPNAGWAPMPEPVMGFSQTHVSGTGGGQKYGNILIQPFLGALENTEHPQERVKEDVALGYYTTVYESGIRTEITTAERCALYRFTAPRKSQLNLVVDAAWFLGRDTIPDKREAQQFVGSEVEITGPNELRGFSRVRGGWNNGEAYTVYFCLQSDEPFRHAVTIGQDGGHYALVSFKHPVANVKVGISYISSLQAKKNIVANGFDAQLKSLKATWEDYLSRIEIAGTEEQMRMFYTAIYHTLLMPVDRTGENPKWTETPYYDDYYAIWDTYRTSTPLLTLIAPDRARDMALSLLNIYRREGFMPDARSGNSNGRTQGGSHGEVVLADAMARGLTGIDYNLALEAMLHDATCAPGGNEEQHGRGGLAYYNTLGYIPYGIDRAGTRTVEYAFDDWCIAQVARRLGRTEVYEEYMKKSENWKNLWRADYEWDGMRGFIMPRDANGLWLDSVPWGKSKVFQPVIPYNPRTKVAPWYIPWWSTFFYEAQSAEYSLSVPHDVPGLIEACGGAEAFEARLDRFFDRGYYNVANEPSFLSPLLYHYIGKPELSTRRVHDIIRKHYSDRPDGLPGNDDSGAMSSWLVWNMMGLYPLAGSSDFLETDPMVTVKTDVRGRLEALKREGEAALARQQAALPKAPTVPLQPKAIAFTLNRQYRTWPVSHQWQGDTLVVTCKEARYSIPRAIVERGHSFAWESPQQDGSRYNDVQGTFCFLSLEALRELQEQGTTVYDGITWRRIGQTDEALCARADVDQTLMWVATKAPLPFVIQMNNNPLGIDWTYE